MGKRLVDVEDLVIWVADELSRKRPPNVLRFPVFDVSRGNRELVGKWSKPMGYPPMSPMFAAGFGQAGGARGDPPHADSLVVEAAIERLTLTTPETPLGEDALRHGLGFPVDAAGALAAALANAANLLLVHGRLASRPALRLEPPTPEPKRAANGKPGVWRREIWGEPTFGDRPGAGRAVEAPCAPKRKNLYPPGAYGVVEWAPHPQEIVNERAEYVAWRAALEWLAQETAGALETRGVLPPGAALAPWMGDEDAGAISEICTTEGLYSADEAATLQAERRAGRRRPVVGGRVYGRGPAKPAKGKMEA